MTPRFDSELTRIYLDKKYSSEFLKTFNLISEKEFTELRISKTIPDFNYDAVKNKSLLLEMRFESLMEYHGKRVAIWDKK